jgi:excisionase family DNA binding protein
METLLTIAELAGLVKLSEQTIRRYVLHRVIPFHKVRKAVRFRPSEIEAWVDRGGIMAGGGAAGEDGAEGGLFDFPEEAGPDAGGME